MDHRYRYRLSHAPYPSDVDCGQLNSKAMNCCRTSQGRSQAAQRLPNQVVVGNRSRRRTGTRPAIQCTPM